MTAPDIAEIDEILRKDGWLRSLVRELVGDAHVEDVLQRTRLAACEQPPSRRAALRSWLRRVAGNFARAHRRAEATRQRLEATVAVPESATVPSTEETVERLAAQRAVTAAVMELPEPYRTAVLLHHYHELAVRDVAARTGTTAANVRQRVKRGLDLIRTRLAGELGDGWRSVPALVAISLPRSMTLSPPPVLSSAGPGAAGAAPAGAAPTILTLWIMKQKLALVGVLAALGTFTIWQQFGADSEVPLDGPSGIAEAATAPGTASELSGGAADGARAELPQTESEVEIPSSNEKWIGMRGKVLDVRGVGVEGVGVGTAAQREIGKFLGSVGLVDRRFHSITETDRDGAFTFTSAPTGPEIVVDPRYFVVRSSVLGRNTSPTEELLIVVAPAVTVSGTVVDEGGRPLEDVAVDAILGELTEFPAPLDATRENDVPGTRSDKAGGFAIGPCPAGVASLRMRKAGFIPWRQPVRADDGRDHRFMMRRVRPGERVLTGVVLDHLSRPVADARVGLAGREVRSDGTGAYRIEFPASTRGENSPHLYAAKAGFQTRVVREVWDKVLEFEPSPGAKNLNVDLLLAGEWKSIAGKVVSSGGWPKSGVSIVLWSEPVITSNQTAPDLALVGTVKPGGLSNLRASAMTSFFGKFELKGLSDRAYRLHIFDPSTCYSHTTEPIRAGKKNVEIRFPKKLYRPPVTGRVVTRSGAAVKRARIGFSGCVFKYEGSTSWSGHTAGHTDDEGNFKLEKIPTSEVQLSFGGAGFISNSIVLGPEDTGDNLVITVEEVCHFRVDVSHVVPVPTRFRLLDVDRKPLGIRESSPNRTSVSDQWNLDKGKSMVLSASERATTLVLLDRDGNEIASVPVRLTPKSVTTLTR